MNLKMTNKGILKISEAPLLRMEEYKQDSRGKDEAGGVLLGRFIKKSKNIVVDRVTVPMIGDRRSRFEFIRNEKVHQRIITSAWNKSGGTINYLGEWHTHPERVPSPSEKDLENWKNILRQGIFSSLYLYFVIVGTKEIRIWEGNRRSEKIKRLYGQ